MYDYDDIKNLVETTDLTKQPPMEEPERQYWFIHQVKLLIEERIAATGKIPTASVVTFGCQMNARDSEKIAGILKMAGFEIIEDEKADLVVYNTCTVRENANLKVYGRLGRLKQYKQNNPDMITVLCGCMMQEPEVIEKLKKSFRNIDIIFGTHNIYKFAELLAGRLMESQEEKRKMVVDVATDTDKIVEELPKDRKYSFKSGVNIMFGCNNFCSYCIVPYVRGRERSREADDIVREICSLVKNGVKEIMLLGQNVNSYGKNLDNPVSFAELLRMVNDIEGLERIRFMTSHPKDLSDELIDAMAECSKVCHQLHLPLQSGSSRLLDIMNRHYTKESYLALTEKIRNKIPDIAISTDIIVGFPGESEEDFEDTLDVIDKVQYESVFTFIYSKRTGTPAAAMENQVPEEVVKKRFDRLLEKVQAISAAKTAMDTGKTVDVLVEEVDVHEKGYVTGRTSKNYVVHFKGNNELIGQIIPVKLKESKGFYYIGEV